MLLTIRRSLLPLGLLFFVSSVSFADAPNASAYRVTRNACGQEL